MFWHDHNPDVPEFSLGMAFVYVTSVMQIAGGVALLWRSSALIGAIGIAVVYALFAVLSIPQIVAAPAVYNDWGNFFIQLSLASGGLILLGRTARAGSLLFGLCVISFALEQAFYLRATASLVPAWIPPNPMFWAVLTTIAFALAAIALLSGYQALLASRLTALMLALFAVLVWAPVLGHAPTNHFDWSETMETIAICGVAWIAADSLGKKPSASHGGPVCTDPSLS